ncbi:MAG TPA: glycosyltransferase [Bryobacteraceae bacterium]|jgi:glycosyltransferase involved in cell wall biosynthesis|nr:glycosyltransferase [Bryobacteraceae bacterium]
MRWDTTIVVPCYNEELRLQLDRFREYLSRTSGVRFLFANDGSRDRTAELLHQFQAEIGDRVDVLDNKINQGKAAVVREGMIRALSGSEFVGFWDADLATPLEAIDDFLCILKTRPEIQMVFGSRVKLLGREVERNALRHYLGRVFATFASITLQLPVYDTQCGAKIFRVTPQLESVLAKPFRSRWIFDVEMIARFLQLEKVNGPRLRDGMYEFPLHRWVDVAGSKVKPKDFLRATLELFDIWRTYR